MYLLILFNTISNVNAREDFGRAIMIRQVKRDVELLQKIEEYESKDTSGQPLPGHTRGKWLPGARTDIESGYWCNPCGRKLASRLVYNRHLLSDLHARRSIREIDDGVHLPRDIPSSYTNRRMSTRRKASFATVMILKADSVIRSNVHIYAFENFLFALTIDQ